MFSRWLSSSLLFTALCSALLCACPSAPPRLPLVNTTLSFSRSPALLRPWLATRPTCTHYTTRPKMLASPLLPSPRFDEGTSYRPAKDLDAFNKLLPPPIEFVEGSSSGLLAVAEGKYPAINESPKSTTTAEVCVIVFDAPSAAHAACRRMNPSAVHLSHLSKPKRRLRVPPHPRPSPTFPLRPVGQAAPPSVAD